MRTTSSTPGYFGGQSKGQRPPVACSSCKRDMAPGTGSQSAPRGTCLMCMAQKKVAIPRARLLIRAGRVAVDPNEVRAFGRGATKGAKRALRRRECKAAIASQSKVAARAFARDADRIRSTRAEIDRRAAARKEAA